MSNPTDAAAPSTDRTALWRDRLLRFAMGGGVTVVGALFAAVRNRWLAGHLATAGIGVLAQIVSAQTWLSTLAGIGLALPVARAVGAGTAGGDLALVRRTTWTALALVGGATAGVVALCLLFAPSVSTVLLGTDAHAALVRISMLGVVALSLQVVMSGFFYGRSDVGAAMIVAVVGGVVSVAVTLALVPAMGLVGGAIGVAIITPVGLAAALLARRRVLRATLTPPPRPALDPSTARTLLSVGVAALLLALLEQGTVLGLRAHYLRVYGIAANGLLQAGLALAQQVSAMFIAYLVGYAFGRISGSVDAVRIRAYTRRHWTPLVALAAAAFGIAMLGAAPLLGLFYTSRFAAARPLMAWALFGEFCRVMTQLWGLGALPLGALGSWIAIGVSGPVAIVAAYLFYAPHAGSLTLPFATATGALVQLGVAAALMARRGVRPTPAGAVLLVLSLVGLALLARTIAG